MWARAVWREGNAEMEDVIPSCWVKKDFVLWPKQGAKKAIKAAKEPEDGWMTFPLLKVKFQSDKREDCDKYDFTTTAELSCSEEERIPEKRQPKKKSYPDYEMGDLPGGEVNECEAVVVADPLAYQQTNDLPPLPHVPKKVQKNRISVWEKGSAAILPKSIIQSRVCTSPIKTISHSRGSPSKNSLSRSPSQTQRSLSPSTSQKKRRSLSPLTSQKNPQSNCLSSSQNKRQSPIQLSSHKKRQSPSLSFSQKKRRSPSSFSSHKKQQSLSPFSSYKKTQNHSLSSLHKKRRSPSLSSLHKKHRSPSLSSLHKKHRSPSPSSSQKKQRSPSQSPLQKKRRSPSWSHSSHGRRSLSQSLSYSGSDWSPSEYLLGRQSSSSSDSVSCSMSASHDEFQKYSKRRRNGDLQKSSSQHLHSRPHKTSKRVRSMTSVQDRERSEPDNSSIFHKASTSKHKTSIYPLSEERFQRKMFQILIDIRDSVKIALRTANGTSFNLKPASCMKDLEELESRFKDKDESAALQAFLRRVGGLDATDMVKKSMSATLTNGVMSQMNLRGKCGKFPFGQTQLFQIICDTVISTHHTTKTEVMDTMSKYLKYAPERMGGGGRRKSVL